MSEQGKEARVAVSILVKNGDRILLLKRQGTTHGNGTWGPPTGHINYSEAPEQTAVRETQEETGVNIDTVKFRTMTNDVFEQDGVHYITLWMEAKYVSGGARVNAPDEMSEVGWYTWDSLPQPLFLPLQNLLGGKTYPSQTLEDGVSAVLPQQRVPTWEGNAEVFQNMQPGETFVARSGLAPEPSETVSNITQSSIPPSPSTVPDGSTVGVGNTSGTPPPDAVNATHRPAENPDQQS